MTEQTSVNPRNLVLYIIVGALLIISIFLIVNNLETKTNLEKLNVRLNSVDIQLSDSVTKFNDIEVNLFNIQTGLSTVTSNVNDTTTKVNALQTSLSIVGNDMSNATTKLSSVETNLSSVQAGLSTITNSVNDTTTKVSTIQTGLTTTNLKIDSINTNINTIKNKLYYTIAWFKTNSRINNASLMTNINSCKTGCIIDIDCIHSVNTNYLKFTYLSDPVNTNYYDFNQSRLDSLQSIQQDIDLKTGDCDDFAFLFKAEFNSLKDTIDCSVITVATATQSFYLNKSNNLNMVCGYNYSLGHCINYFTDTSNINRYIEPQGSGKGQFTTFDAYPYSREMLTDDDYTLCNPNNDNCYSYKEVYNLLTLVSNQ